jgi:hypothetical protein
MRSSAAGYKEKRKYIKQPTKSNNPVTRLTIPAKVPFVKGKMGFSAASSHFFMLISRKEKNGAAE